MRFWVAAAAIGWAALWFIAHRGRRIQRSEKIADAESMARWKAFQAAADRAPDADESPDDSAES
jgi:hypothetical protein